MKKNADLRGPLIHLAGLAVVLLVLLALALTKTLDSQEATALLTLAGGFLGAGGTALGHLLGSSGGSTGGTSGGA